MKNTPPNFDIYMYNIKVLKQLQQLTSKPPYNFTWDRFHTVYDILPKVDSGVNITIARRKTNLQHTTENEIEIIVNKAYRNGGRLLPECFLLDLTAPNYVILSMRDQEQKALTFAPNYYTNFDEFFNHVSLIRHVDHTTYARIYQQHRDVGVSWVEGLTLIYKLETLVKNNKREKIFDILEQYKYFSRADATKLKIQFGIPVVDKDLDDDVLSGIV